ncbi:MAG: hypothetical protein FJZ01_03775 [Candidatus Sericytochromatia bacterium]|nr:hypothetical protein [Candidatus Tanganyikabacteria bacterium]
MPIAIAAEGGWKRPTIGPGLEAFAAGDARAPGVVAAGGPGDVGLQAGVGAPATITLADPAPVPPAPAPGGPLSEADLLKLVAAMTALLASLTGLVARLVEQRGLQPARAA